MSTRERLTFGHGAHAAVPRRAAVAVAELAHEPRPVRLTHPETWDWGWGGLLIFSVLLFFRPQDQLEALGRAHGSDIAAIIGLGAMAILNTSRREPITRVTPELLGIFALGLIILGTAPFSIWPGGVINIFKDMY